MGDIGVNGVVGVVGVEGGVDATIEDGGCLSPVVGARGCLNAEGKLLLPVDFFLRLMGPCW